MNKKDLTSLKQIYLFIDLDDTIISNDEKRILLEPQVIYLFPKLKEKNIKLIISSRNPPYIVEDILEKHGFSEYFVKIIADYRKKKYQIKQVLANDNYLLDDQILIIFIDDYLENCKDVHTLKANLNASIIIINYKKSKPYNLEFILTRLLEDNITELEKIQFRKES